MKVIKEGRNPRSWVSGQLCCPDCGFEGIADFGDLRLRTEESKMQGTPTLAEVSCPTLHCGHTFIMDLRDRPDVMRLLAAHQEDADASFR